MVKITEAKKETNCNDCKHNKDGRCVLYDIVPNNIHPQYCGGHCK